MTLGTDQTLISPDTEPEHIMDEDEKDRLRTDDLWPHRDWGEEQKTALMQYSKYSDTSAISCLFVHKMQHSVYLSKYFNLFKKYYLENFYIM